MKKLLLFLTLTAMLLFVHVNAQTPIFSEGFESGNLPTGWTLIDADNDGQTWELFYQGHGNDYDGYSFASYSQNNATPDNWLVTPAITLGTSSTLTFWRMRGFFGSNEHYGVYVSTTSATDPTAFTLLFEETPSPYSWQEKTVNLDNYDNSTVHIAFRHFNCTNQFAIVIDDILVTSTMASSVITVEPGSLHFTDVPASTLSAGQLVTVNAFNLTDVMSVSVNAPFEISTDNSNFSLGLTMTETDHDLYVRYAPNTAGTDTDIVSIVSGTASATVMLYGNSIACEMPTSLSVTSITSNSANVSWSGSANSYDIYYKAASDTDWTVIENVFADSTGYTIGDLTPSTTYTWYVAALCDDGSSSNSTETGTFTTGCAMFSVPFVQTFDATSLPQCWERYTGWASNVFAGGGLASTTGSWTFNSTDVFGAYHARLNIYGTSCNKWLVTPNIDLNGISYPTLTFELALTAYNGGGAITPNNQPDDKFMVIISTDDGATWSAANAIVWSNDGNGDFVYDQIPATGQEISISLSDYANQSVMIAFYGESTVSNGDNYLRIDNVMVNAATSCPKPSSLDVTAVTSSSVTLAWTENGTATAWNIEYGPTGYQQGSSAATIVPANTNPFTINNLTMGTYDFYVQADCENEQSLWLGPVTATPGSYNMGITGSDTLTTCSLIVYDNGGSNGNYSAYCDYTLVLLPEVNGNSIAVSGNFHTETCCDYLRIYDGTNTSGALLGEYKGTGTIPTLVSFTGPMTIVFHSDNGLQYDGFELNVSCVSCTPPSNLTVTNISHSAADLNWTGEYSLYTVEYKAAQDTEWVTTTTTDTSFSLTGLHDYTVYTVNIYGDCNGEPSPAAHTAFTTTMVPAGIPFSTDFSTPTDWVFNNGNCNNYWTIQAVSDTSNALFVTNNGNTPGYNTNSFSVVSVEKLFTIGETSEVEISFDVQIGGESMFDFLKVFFAPVDETYPAATTNTTYANESYSINAVNFTDFMQYSTYISFPYKFNLTNGNTVHVTVVMPNPNGTPNANSTAKLVFLWKNDQTDGTQPGAIVRSVSVAPLACPAPTNLSVSNITSTSADISWNAAGDENNWILEYKANGDSIWTSIPVSGNPAYSLTGLTVGISYQIRLKAVCDDDIPSLWVSTLFTTFCDAVTIFPFTEDFEHGGLLPDCWSQEYAYGILDWTFQAGCHSHGNINEAHSGSYNAYLFMDSEDGISTRLVTPILDLSDMSEAYLTYWHAQQPWGNNQDLLAIYYRSNPNDQWQLLIRHTSAINYWTKDSLALPNLSATYQLAFVGVTDHGNGVVLDDITVDGTYNLPVITDPTVSTIPATNVEQTTATLNAFITNPSNVTIEAKGFEWKLSNSDTYTQIAGSGTDNTFSASLINLNANTSYTFKAFITYNETTVYGSEITFITQGVGIDNLTIANNISLMPNPADNYIELSVNSNVKMKEAVVYNAFGQIIQTITLTDNHARIDLSDMATGMYFVRVNGENVTATKKFVKK